MKNIIILMETAFNSQIIVNRIVTVMLKSFFVVVVDFYNPAPLL